MRPGLKLVDRYRLAERLGRGGMGEVWRATDLRLDRDVAVKLLSVNWTGDAMQAALVRFRREGQAAARLNHPHIADVYDVGDHDGQPFLVLELLAGPDLETLVNQRPGGLQPPTRRTGHIARSLINRPWRSLTGTRAW